MNWIKIEREWVGKYIHHRNLLNKGRNELSWFSDVLKIFGVAGAVSFASQLKQNWHWLIVGTLIYLSFCYLVGVYWEKRHHFDLENEWGNERNPMLKKISKAVKKK